MLLQKCFAEALVQHAGEAASSGSSAADSGKHVGSFSFACLRGDRSSPGAITEGGLGETTERNILISTDD